MLSHFLIRFFNRAWQNKLITTGPVRVLLLHIMNTIIVTLNRKKNQLNAERNERLFNNAVVGSLIFKRERIKFGNGHSDPLFAASDGDRGRKMSRSTKHKKEISLGSMTSGQPLFFVASLAAPTTIRLNSRVRSVGH